MWWSKQSKQYTYIYIQRHSAPAEMNVKGTESSILYYNKEQKVTMRAEDRTGKIKSQWTLKHSCMK